MIIAKVVVTKARTDSGKDCLDVRLESYIDALVESMPERVGVLVEDCCGGEAVYYRDLV